MVREQIMIKTTAICKAYFISPVGLVLPVFQTHIQKIIDEPEIFGLTGEYVLSKYDEYHEVLGHEGMARNEIIAGLLAKGWIRVRIDGNGYCCCQVGMERKRIFKNIMKLLDHLRIVRGRRECRGLGLRVYVEPGKYLIDAYNANESDKMLVRKLAVRGKRRE